MMIEVITTGGTFDKIYHPEKGELLFPEESFIKEILKTARVSTPFSHTSLAPIDSLEMTDDYRKALSIKISHSPSSKIIITHGTDTMAETAEFLRLKNIDKTIILCGAMRPHSLGQSDASFNLGFALGVAQLLPNGVYIAMNGQIFEEGVRKNKAIGRFEA